ncbi:MAG: DUF4173 domain-containing protein [Clostridia bacterium]|nr:DUF4173 domain-containing protein [Clostridia bacterium]
MNEETYINEKKKVQMSFVDILTFPVVFGLTTYLITAVLDLFWNFNSKGLHTALSYFGFFLVATAYILTKRKTFSKEAILPGVFALLTAVSYIIHGDEAHFIFTFLMLIYLSGSYCVKMTGEAKDTYGSYFYLLEVWRSEVLIPVKNTFLPLRSLKTLKKTSDGEKKKLSGKALGIIGGAVLSIPVIAVVVPLLIDGDAAFGSVAQTAMDKIELVFEKFFDGISSGLLVNAFLALFVAPYIYNVMFCFRHSVTDEKRQEKNKRYENLRFVPSNVFAGFLGVISLVYVVYLLSQFAYFFSAFTGKLPDGSEISVAQYARRGFFEMAAVAVINLGIIGVTVIFSKRADGKISRMIKAFDLFLCGFTVVLVATSISKILLYIAEMGLTHKRIYVFVADLILLVAFAMIIVRLLKKNFPYMKVILGFACGVITLMSLVGTDSLIANYNVEMYLRGNLKTVDTYQLENMGLSALKPLHKLALNEKESDKILNYSAKQAVANVFYYNAVHYGTPEEYMEKGVIDRGFTNFDDYLALKYAKENFGPLSDIHLNYGWWYGKMTEETEIDLNIEGPFVEK